MSLFARAERVAIEIRNLRYWQRKKRPPQGGLSITLIGAAIRLRAAPRCSTGGRVLANLMHAAPSFVDERDVG